MCPHGRRLLAGEGGWLETTDVVCHCLLIETDDGLVLVDTGFGVEDIRDLGRLGPTFRLMRPQARIEETALKQVEALGFAAGDVRRIVATHLDPDHSGGLPDFPDAEVHVFARELEAALEPEPARPPALPRRPTGPTAPTGSGTKSKATSGSASKECGSCPGPAPRCCSSRSPGTRRATRRSRLRTGEGWLLHCGDAYFHHGELSTPPHCPPGLSFFQNLNNADRRQRLANQERLRELAGRHGDEIAFVCSHDPHELERELAKAAAAVPTGE